MEAHDRRSGINWRHSSLSGNTLIAAPRWDRSCLSLLPITPSIITWWFISREAVAICWFIETNMLYFKSVDDKLVDINIEDLDYIVTPDLGGLRLI